MKQNLLFSPVAAGSLHREWTTGETKFSCHINIYDDSEHGPAGVEGVDSVTRIKKHKWPTIDQLLSETDWLDRFEYFMFTDYDVSMSSATVDGLFAYASRNGLSLAQPALTSHSYGSHPITFQQRPTGHRASHIVEIMTPIFSNEALRAVRHTLAESESGWGLDLIWPGLIGSCYIIDEFPVTHTRPVRSQNWVLENGLTPAQEMQQVLRKYSLRPE